MFLLGKQQVGGGWSSFSGKLREGETVEEGALREFTEETLGIFGHATQDLRRSIHQRRVTHGATTPSGGEFTLFCVPCFPSSDPTAEQRRYAEAKDKVEGGEAEKAEIRWVRWADLQSIKLRRGFKEESRAIVGLVCRSEAGDPVSLEAVE